MAEFLVDTNVWSEFIKKNPESSVKRWYAEATQLLYISAITLHEFEYGLGRLDSPTRRKMGLRIISGCPVLDVNEEIARIAVQLRLRALKQGITIHLADALIGSTALHHDLTVVTRNVRDFEPIAVEVINPFA